MIGSDFYFPQLDRRRSFFHPAGPITIRNTFLASKLFFSHGVTDLPDLILELIIINLEPVDIEEAIHDAKSSAG